jgi:uncharacterized membrane protein YagU involved in acid resistance
MPAGSIAAAVAGVVYGIVWWVLGALISMPLMLGMPQMVFVIEQPQIMSLMGHVIYGVITALLFMPLSKRL